MKPRLRILLAAALILTCAGIPAWFFRHSVRSMVRSIRGHAAVLVITRGGAYTGTWESNDASVPVILINTAEPVVIERSMLRGRGTLIATGVDHADVTIRNTRGVGLNPDAAGKAPGRFLSAEFFDNVVLENNTLENTAGIYLNTYRGDFAPNHTVKVLRNRAKNIDGRRSDGRGGFLDFNSRQRVDGSGRTEDGFDIVQFLQLDKVRRLPGVEIAWNEVINDPGISRVEDNINLFQSSGTKDSPIRVHDNFIRGAYAIAPWKSDSADSTWNYHESYSGGGILLADGSSETVEGAAGFAQAYDNQVLDTSNYGIAISAGHDCVIHHNRILSAGRLPDGRQIAAQNVGAYIWDAHQDAARNPATFFNNTGRDNQIGWMKGNGRNDAWTPDAKEWSNITAWPEPLRIDTYAAEWAIWQKKLLDAKVEIGRSDAWR